MAPRPEQIAPPEAVVPVAIELGGAAYRSQKHSWAPQADNQQPYWAGFNLASRFPMQSEPQEIWRTTHEDVGVEEAAPPVHGDGNSKLVNREMRLRPHGGKAVQAQPKAERENVLNPYLLADRMGSRAPQPQFLIGQQIGRY